MTTPIAPTMPCPHCGKMYNAGSMVGHAPACLSSPAVLARVRAALEDPACPGRAVGETEYNAAAALNGAPRHNTLRKTWGRVIDICERVGLAVPEGYVPVATAREYESRACTHCGQMHDTRLVALHERRCIANPAVRAATAEALSDPLRPGCAVTPAEFKEWQPGTEAAPFNTLMRLYGSWAGICEEFGLASPLLRGNKRGAKARQLKIEEAELKQARLDAEEAARNREAMGREGLKVCRTRELPDGRVACMLRGGGV